MTKRLVNAEHTITHGCLRDARDPLAVLRDVIGIAQGQVADAIKAGHLRPAGPLDVRIIVECSQLAEDGEPLS